MGAAGACWDAAEYSVTVPQQQQKPGYRRLQSPPISVQHTEIGTTSGPITAQSWAANEEPAKRTNEEPAKRTNQEPPSRHSSAPFSSAPSQCLIRGPDRQDHAVRSWRGSREDLLRAEESWKSLKAEDRQQSLKSWKSLKAEERPQSLHSQKSLEKERSRGQRSQKRRRLRQSAENRRGQRDQARRLRLSLEDSGGRRGQAGRLKTPVIPARLRTEEPGSGGKQQRAKKLPTASSSNNTGRRQWAITTLL